MQRVLAAEPAVVPGWTFLSNHAHVLLCITRDPEVRLTEVARRVGIGERAVHNIVNDLVEAGYVTRTRVGRRNIYEVDLERPLRHPLEADHSLDEIIRPLAHRKKSRVRPSGPTPSR